MMPAREDTQRHPAKPGEFFKKNDAVVVRENDFRISSKSKIESNSRGDFGSAFPASSFVLFGLFALVAFSGCAKLQLLPDGKPFSQVYNFSSGGWKVPWETAEERTKRGKELIRKANEFSRNGHETESIKLLEEAKELNPEDTQIYLTTGQIFARVGNYPQSASELEKGLAIDPLSIPLNLALSETLIDQGNYDEAIGPNQIVLNQDSENVEALRQKLRCFFHLQRDSEAIGVGYQLLAILPNDFSTKESLCKIYLRIHKPRRSWILLQQLVEMFEPEKLPSNLRYLEFQTLLAMHRDSDAALSLQRWYHHGGSNDSLWTECYNGCPDFLKQSAQKYLTQKPSEAIENQIETVSGQPILASPAKKQIVSELLFDNTAASSPDHSNTIRLPIFQPLFR